MSKQSTYSIVMRSSGASSIIADFRKMQEEARKTARTLTNEQRRAQREQERLDRQRQTQARQREREAQREALRAVREAENAQRRLFREQQRLRQEDLAQHRRYVSQLRKQESDLREERSKSMRRAGIGVAGLIGIGAGVKTAADFESAMTDLRLSIQRLGKDGQIDLARLNQEMKEFEALSIRLGNALPGTTADFVELFAELRKGGIDTSIILDGAGEAVANLAVLVKQTPKDLADPYAQLGQMLDLKPGDYTRSADLFARLYRTVGLKPEQLIESAKYAVPRALAPLGLEGYGGLETTAEMMGLLKRRGLEGSIAGTQVSQLMSRLTFHRRTQGKELAGLAGQGIKLDFFDKKGNFAGIENFIAQMEKLKVLSQEKRFEVFTKLFGEEARGAAQIFMQTGVQGYREFQAELRSIPPLQSQINELQKDFNQKLEAMLGTGKNVVVRVFTPLMNTIKPALDLTNQVFSNLEGFSRAHPGISKTATTLLGLGSAYLVVSGGIGAASRTLALWRITGRLAAAENALLAASYRGVGVQATAAATQMQTASLRGSGLIRGLSRGLAFGVGAWFLTEILTGLDKTRQAREDAQQAGKELGESIREGLRKEMSGMSHDAIAAMRKVRAPGEAKLRVKSLQLDRGIKELDEIEEIPAMLRALAALRYGSAQTEKGYGYAPVFGKAAQESMVIEALRNSGIRTVEDMKATLEEVRASLARGGSSDLIVPFEKLAQGVFPGLFDAAVRQIQKEAEMAQATGAVTTELRGLQQVLGQINNNKPLFINNFGKPVLGGVSGGFNFGGFKVPGMAEGGIVTRPIVSMMGERGPEAVIPLDKLSRIQRAPSIALSVQVDARGASDPAAVEAAVRRGATQSKEELFREMDQHINRELRERLLSS